MTDQRVWEAYLHTGEFQDLRPGSELNNGARLVSIERIGDDEAVVLAVRPESTDHYVTWRVDTRTGECYWGHYFTSFMKATADFFERGAH